MFGQTRPTANLTNSLREGRKTTCGRETLDRVRTLERMRALFTVRNISVMSPVTGEWYEIETDVD